MARQPRPAAKITQDRRTRALILTTYVLLVAFYFVASFAPDLRTWGFNWWAYFPLWGKLGLFTAAVVAGVLIDRFAFANLSPRGEKDQPASSFSRYLLFTAPVVILLGAGFILFPSSTHFLGDGYQLLSLLASGVKAVKAWDYGATTVNVMLYDLVSGDNTARALTAFRAGSVLFGLVLLIGMLPLAFKLFSDTTRRVLFYLAIATGGYMLMCFGYVENYAGLITALTLYAVVGLLAAQGIISRWFAVIPAAAAIFFHLFALVLLPSLLYLIVHDRKLPVTLPKWSTPRGKLILAGCAAVGLVAYYFIYKSSYFFMFALMPLWPDRFTVDSDWLFSPKHFIDLLNLVLILVPGLPIGVLALSATPKRTGERGHSAAFLLLFAVSALAAVWVFNPGIGMPRNWDLFAIAGPPLMVLLSWMVLERVQPRRLAYLTVALSIAASILMLGPRVASQATDQIALAHFRAHLKLDPVRSRNARSLLVDYYERRGDTATANIEQARAESAYPESAYGKKGGELVRQGNTREAMLYLRKALEVNPLFYDAYGNLGLCYMQMGNLDSAQTLLEICNGMNAYNPGTLSNLGTVALRRQRFDQALNYFSEALRVDSTFVNAFVGMASLYLQMNDADKSVRYVEQLYQSGQLSADYFRQAGDAYLAKGAAAQAARAYHLAEERGLDSAAIADIRAKNPALQW